MNTTALYQALVSAEVPEDLAARAVESLPIAAELATKVEIAEVKAEIAEVKAEIIEVKAQLETQGNRFEAQLETQGNRLEAQLEVQSTELKAQINEIRMCLDGMATKVEVAALEARLTWRLLGGNAILLSIWVAVMKLI